MSLLDWDEARAGVGRWVTRPLTVGPDDAARDLAPHLRALADALHTSFIQFVEKRDDRLESVCFDYEVQESGVAPASTTGATVTAASNVSGVSNASGSSSAVPNPNPSVLKILVAISEALVRGKGHLEEGVFRQPGSTGQGVILREKVRNVCLRREDEA